MMYETPISLVFGRQARLAIDFIFGILRWVEDLTKRNLAQKTRENLQVVFELARQNLGEGADKQQQVNSKLPQYHEFIP